MFSRIRYWRKGEPLQNFGDFLSDFFQHRLFCDTPVEAKSIRIVGSTIAEGIINNDLAADDDATVADRVVYWGCGLRLDRGLTRNCRSKVTFLAVRGPLTRAVLGLDDTVPLGDPGLLLPALHHPAAIARQSGKKVLVPHFTDTRSDEALLEITGCTQVVRPGIPASREAVTGFVDQLLSADFVLCGALHAAVTAAAYGGRFGFWDSGNIDIPFKWRDFAASVAMPCVFSPTLAAAEAVYDASIRPGLSIPPLWPLLRAAPFAVRAEAFLEVIRQDIRRHGPTVLDAPPAPAPMVSPTA